MLCPKNRQGMLGHNGNHDASGEICVKRAEGAPNGCAG